MDGKRRTSLLRKSVYARDENTVASCTPRLKRRISFSGKHLVREFHREEEPKAWENSYEISDHLNADEIGSKVSMFQNKSLGSCAHQNQTNSTLQYAPLEHNAPIPEPPHTRNVLSTSRDLVNVTDQNNTLCIENSVNITLFESEKQYFAKHKVKQPFPDENLAYSTNIDSFSLNENEMIALSTLRLNILGERTIDFMEDVRHETCRHDKDDTNAKHISVHEMHKDENEDCIGVTVYSECMDEADCMKSIFDENRDGKEAVTIYTNDSLSTSSSELPDSKQKADNTKTLKMSIATDFSPGKAMDLDKENIHPAISPETVITSNTSCFMDIENGFDLPIPNPNIEKESKRFQEKLDRISFLKNYNDNTHMLLKQDDFTADIERSPVKPKTCRIRNSINTYDDMNVSPTHINISESSCKNGLSSKLVVRKICTPFSSKAKNPVDLDKQMTQRYKQKKELNVLLDPDLFSLAISPNPKPVANQSVLENSLNFSLSNTKSITLSPETSSSLLIPSQYKSYNFKQLNDEFECGKIQLFSKTNTADRKPTEYSRINKNIAPEPFKQRRTLFFDGDITSDHSSSKDYKPTDSNDYFDFNVTRGTADRETNIKCRFSQADDLMLDSTSFLAKAKLGDETTSRNSTKRDITQFNDVDIFVGSSREDETELDISVMKAADKNNANDSLHSMFQDDKLGLKHNNIGNKNDNFMSLCNVDSLEECESRLVCNLSVFSKNHKNRQTVTLNGDLDLPANERNKHLPTNEHIHSKRDTSESKIYPESTFCRYDDIDLDEGTEAHNGKTSFTGKKSKYQIKDMEFNGENLPNFLKDRFTLGTDSSTNNLIQLSLPFKQKEEESKSLTKNNLPRRKHTKHFTGEHHGRSDISHRLTFCSEREGNKSQRKTIFFDNESCIEKLDTETLETSPDKKKIVPTFHNNSDSNGLHVCNKEQSIMCTLAVGKRFPKHCGNDTTCSQVYQEKNNIEREKRHRVQEIVDRKKYNRDEIDYNRMANSNDLAKSHSRKTLYFNQKIETESLQKQSAENSVKCSRNWQEIDNNLISVPVHRDMDLDEFIHTSNRDEDLYYKSESVLMEVEKDCTLTLNTASKTLQYNDEIVEMDLCVSIQKSSEDKETIPICSETEKDSQKILLTRKTLYFNDDIGQMERSKLNNSKSDCIEGCPMEKTYSQHLYADISSNEHDGPIFEQKTEIMETQLQQTITETLGDIELKDEHCQTIYIDNIIDDAVISPPYNAVYKNKDVSDAVPVNLSSASSDNSCCPTPMSLNAAKLAFARQRHFRNSLTSNHKSFIQNDNYLVTPVKASVNRERLFEVTPRLSLNEFLAYEKRVESSSEKDENINICVGDNQYKTTVGNDTSIKRLPINLTPILSTAKKRHTLVFSNCDIDESMTTNHDSCKIIEMKNEKCDVRDTNSQMNTSDIDSCQSVLQTPLKQRKSRIPVPLSSGKKNNVLQLDSNLNKIGGINELSRSELICDEGENCTQSIQEMRRATTFDHIHYNFNEPKSQIGLEFQQTAQRLVFEDNPITISDVSVYFQAQKKHNAVTCDLSNTAIEEIKGKHFQKRYLNLTCGSELEDIDQTRLCLVGTLSYEDTDKCETEGTNSETGDRDIRPEMDYPIKTNKRSMNQSRNLSTICLKCKRCETTSSMTDSFVLPALPPATFLDLERLRRFRNSSLRISDANLLWQRASLDRTVINLNNVSGDGSKQFSIFKDFGDEDSSVVITPIQKYQNYIQRLIGSMGPNVCTSHSIRTSLISRLEDLFRVHSPNWIFDYQLQHMGVMTFTNKTILTFSLNLTYEEKDALGKEIQLKTVTLEKNNTENWKPIDFILDFQLKLNLPFDLMSLCESSNEFGIFKMLTKIDEVCMETNEMGTQLQRIVFANRAAIIRDEHRTFVRKIVRNLVLALDQFKHVENPEFRIEILNVKKLSFRDITMPSLYNFCEDIHLLPVGLEFLNEFLNKPVSYLKENVPIRVE